MTCRVPAGTQATMSATPHVYTYHQLCHLTTCNVSTFIWGSDTTCRVPAGTQATVPASQHVHQQPSFHAHFNHMQCQHVQIEKLHDVPSARRDSSNRASISTCAPSFDICMLICSPSVHAQPLTIPNSLRCTYTRVVYKFQNCCCERRLPLL